MSKNYILCEKGNDYKANLHCHSTVSDGCMTPEELKKFYMDKGYSVLAYTDHDLFVPHPELCDSDFLALNGYEMEFYDYDTTEDFLFLRTTHINFIALDEKMDVQPFFHRERYFIGNGVKNKGMIKFDETQPDFVRYYTPECVNYVMKTNKENGFFVIYNHPRWSLEHYDVYSKYTEMDALELMNGGSIEEGFIEHNHQVYDDLLNLGTKVGAVGGDDNHATKDAFWCWTVIRADNLDYKSVADALKKGNYYATNGPVIKELYEEDGKIYVKTSDAKSIVFTTGIRHAGHIYDKNGGTVSEGVFELKPEDKYVRVTVLGADGTVAYSNPYFLK